MSDLAPDGISPADGYVPPPEPTQSLTPPVVVPSICDDLACPMAGAEHYAGFPGCVDSDVPAAG